MSASQFIPANQNAETAFSSDDPLFRGLFRFIRLNKTIPAALNKLTLDHPGVTKLFLAIKKGDAKAGVFSDRNCYLYLLFLMRTKKINFWSGITVYVYLMALMQLTMYQPIKEQDQDAKIFFREEIVISSLVQEGKISEKGGHYLQQVCKDFSNLGLNLDCVKLVELVLKLDPVDQWLLEVPYYHCWVEDKKDYDRLIEDLMGNIPFFQKGSGRFSTMALVPSSPFINYVLETLFDRPLKPQPCFGNPGYSSLRHMHKEGIHPLQLYGLDVKNNVLEVHRYEKIIFPQWMHDIGHVLWGNLLKAEGREFIFNDLLPALKALKQKTESQEIKHSITVIKRHLCDYDLIPISMYTDPKKRFARYFKEACLGANQKIRDKLEPIVEAKKAKLSC